MTRQKLTSFRVRTGSGSQKGAALFVALMLLIIMSLLAVSAAQVTALQERMAAAYWSDMRTFESAEAAVRQTERSLSVALDDVVLPGFEDPCFREVGEDPVFALQDGSWTPPANGFEFFFENYTYGEGSRGSGRGGSIGAGEAASGANCSIFRVTVIRADDPSEPTSRSIVQTTFVQ